MSKADDFFRDVVLVAETAVQFCVTSLWRVLTFKGQSFSRSVAAQRIRRRGEYVSSRSMLFFVSTALVIAVSYSNVDQTFRQVSSIAQTWGQLTGPALFALLLAAALDLLARAASAHAGHSKRRLDSLRDTISGWLVILTLTVVLVAVVSHGEYWFFSTFERNGNHTIAWLIATAAVYLLFVGFWQLVGRYRAPWWGKVVIGLLGLFVFTLASVAGASSYELDSDERGDPNVKALETSCALDDQGAIHVAVTLISTSQTPLWVEDSGQDQLLIYDGGYLTYRRHPFAVQGGSTSTTATVQWEGSSEGLLMPGKTLALRGKTLKNGFSAPATLWTCEYAGPIVSHLEDIPTRVEIAGARFKAGQVLTVPSTGNAPPAPPIIVRGSRESAK